MSLETRTVRGLNKPVSAIGAGCWTIGGPAVNNGTPIGWDDVDPDQALAGLVRAHELGVRLFDTADVYGLGRSERLLGRFLEGVDREQLVVASKVGYFAGTAAHPYAPAQMLHQLDTSLDNLGTDHLDLYTFHSSDFGDDDTYLPDAIAQMRTFREEELIGAIGLRAPHEFAVELATRDDRRSREAARFLHLFQAIQPEVIIARYNLLSPTYGPGETDIFAFARRHGAGVLVKQALGQGLLARTDPGSGGYSAGDHRRLDPHFQPAARQIISHTVQAIADEFGSEPDTLTRLALRYALAADPDSAVLVGFRDPAQIEQNITCLGNPLTPKDLARLRELTGPARTLLQSDTQADTAMTLTVPPAAP